jgi:hypothetical protein
VASHPVRPRLADEATCRMAPVDRSKQTTPNTGVYDARPRLSRTTVWLLLAGGVACWLLLQFAPSADRSTAAVPPVATPAPGPMYPTAAAAPARPALTSAPSLPRPGSPAEIGSPAPPKPHFDPATDPPTIHSRDGLSIERTWGNSRALPREYGQHGKEFSARSVFHYAAMAAHFFQEAPKYGFPSKVDDDGVIRIYDPGSNTYGEYNPDGTTRAFFRPPQGAAFWNEQPGSAPLAP